jgi:hypothetical protein
VFAVDVVFVTFEGRRAESFGDVGEIMMFDEIRVEYTAELVGARPDGPDGKFVVVQGQEKRMMRETKVQIGNPG